MSRLLHEPTIRLREPRRRPRPCEPRARARALRAAGGRCSPEEPATQELAEVHDLGARRRGAGAGLMRIGTRRSALALAQAELVAEDARRRSGEIVPIATGGDRGAAIGDKSRWVDELEQALLDGEIDLAVHSAKDVPGELAAGLELLGAARAGGGRGRAVRRRSRSRELPAGARVGTSSLRRAGAAARAREDLEVVAAARQRRHAPAPARGGRTLDAIVLAAPGCSGSGATARAAAVLDPERLRARPRAGHARARGASGRRRARSAAAPRSPIAAHARAACSPSARSRARSDADCDTPLGAHAALAEGRLRLRALVGPARRLGLDRRRARRRDLRPRGARRRGRRAPARRRRRASSSPGAREAATVGG